MTTTTFLFPSFNKCEEGKVNNDIDVPSEHVLVKSANCNPVPAIASEGFPSNRNGTYVFVTRVEKAGKTDIGFTSTKTLDSRVTCAAPSCGGMCGSCLFTGGKLFGGAGDSSTEWSKVYFPSSITLKAKEIIAILTISENGRTKEIQFICDGNDGAAVELANTDFENENGGSQIFPTVSIYNKRQKLSMIPFNQVKFRSPRIDELMKEFWTLQNGNIKEQELPKKTQIKKTAKKVAVPKPNATTKKIVSKKENKKKAPSTKKKAAKKATKKAGKKIGKK